MNATHGNLSRTHTKTRKGADGYTTAGLADPTSTDPLETSKARLTGLFAELTRGCSRRRVEDGVRDVIRETPTTHRNWAYQMLVSLAFQTRDSRDGKGEKDLSRWILVALYEFIPTVILKVVPLLPEYGYWKDLPLLVADIIDSGKKRELAPLLDVVYKSLVDALKQDHQSILSWTDAGSQPRSKPTISLVSKFIPKENRAYDRKYKITKELAKRTYPSFWAKDFRSALRQFRKTVSRLNRFIDTTEIKMSARSFSTIDFNHVPSKCMATNRKAFLNQKRGPNHSIVDRHPDVEDRIECRQNLLSHMEEANKGTGKAKVHGGQLNPYDIVHSLLDNNSSWQATLKKLPQEELDLIDLQFKDMRSRLVDTVPTDTEKASSLESQGSMSGLKRTVPMIDVSGSMMGSCDAQGNYQGIPLKVAVGLGITLSTLGQSPFGHRFLTFHESPSWVELRPEWPIHRMVETALRSQWGGTTNILSAFQLILSHAQTHGLEKADLPDRLVIFSDMDFDAAHRTGSYYSSSNLPSKPWSTTYMEIQSMWSAAGYGSPPEVVFWNLNAKKVAFPCRANTPGVRLISGWSPALFKLFVDDDLDSYREPTPWETTEKALLDEKYGPVRNIVSSLLNVAADSVGSATSGDTSAAANAAIAAAGAAAGAATAAASASVSASEALAAAPTAPEGWVAVDYSTDPPVMTHVSSPSPPKKSSSSLSSSDKDELRNQLQELQKQQMALMAAQQKLMAKLG